MIGSWENFEHLEDSICLDELYALVEELQETEYNRNRFAASLKGVNLDEERAKSDQSSFAEIERRAKKRLAGESQEQIVKSEDEELGLFEAKESDW